MLNLRLVYIQSVKSIANASRTALEAVTPGNLKLFGTAWPVYAIMLRETTCVSLYFIVCKRKMCIASTTDTFLLF